MTSGTLRLRLHQCLPPLLVFCAGRLVISLAAWHEKLSVWTASTWARGDSIFYYTIATKGYQIYPCAEHIWCGNTGWFPAYPFLIRLMRTPWTTSGLVGMTLSAAFAILTLIVLWNGLLEPSDSALSRWTALGIAGFFPGHVYYHALYPVSMLTLCLVLFLWFAKKSNWTGAALTGLVAGTCHPTAIWLGPITVLWAVMQRKDLRKNFWPLAAVAAAPLLGFFLVFVYQRMVIGWWGSCFTIHEADYLPRGWSWDKVLNILIIPCVHGVTPLVKSVLLTQSITVDFVVLWLAQKRLTAKEKTFSAWHDLALLCVLVFWITPHLTGYWISYYREESFLIPLSILSTKLSPEAAILLLLIVMSLSYPMALFFFQSRLV